MSTVAVSVRDAAFTRKTADSFCLSSLARRNDGRTGAHSVRWWLGLRCFWLVAAARGCLDSGF